MRVVQKMRIAAPRKTVWALVSDGRCYPQFMADTDRWEVVSDEPTGCGARWQVLMRVGSASVGGLFEIVEFDEPANLAFNAITGLAVRGRWRLRERVPGVTDVEFRLAYQSPGGVLGLIADRVAVPLVRRSLRQSLRNLRDVVENGAKGPAPRRESRSKRSA